MNRTFEVYNLRGRYRGSGDMIKEFKTVDLSGDGNAVEIIDQRLLPGKMEIIRLETQEEIFDAISALKVRGAPAIGVAAAMGIYLAAKDLSECSEKNFFDRLKKCSDYLASSRPTAVNLFWALERMERKAEENRGKSVKDIVALLKQEAELIRDEDREVCRKIGEHGAPLIKHGMGILTHCNAGALATSAYGTATSPVYHAYENGVKDIRVFCDETRPLLQGARLTSFELNNAGISTTLICDNMASSVMDRGLVDIVLVGCDRVASNGDTANKIGTSAVAILANHYGIPFYVCAPFSTIDFSIKTGKEIVIEERNSDEVTEMWYRERMAPEGIDVYNPAFDITPHTLISGFITEKGIILPPFK